jgi:hypothetical protein
MAELLYYSKKNSLTMQQIMVTTPGRQRTQFSQKELESLRNIQGNTTGGRTRTQKTRFLPVQIISKDTRLQILQDPTNSVLRQVR